MALTPIKLGGYDQDARPPWILVPLKSERQFGYHGNLQNTWINTSTGTIASSRFDSRFSRLTISGLRRGTTRLRVWQGSRSPKEQYQVEVRKIREITLVFHFVSDKTGRCKTARNPNEMNPAIIALNELYEPRTCIRFKNGGIKEATLDKAYPNCQPISVEDHNSLVPYAQRYPDAINVFLVWAEDRKQFELRNRDGVARHRTNFCVVEDHSDFHRKGDPRDILAFAHEIGDVLLLGKVQETFKGRLMSAGNDMGERVTMTESRIMYEQARKYAQGGRV
jgi:hypothetical protein